MVSNVSDRGTSLTAGGILSILAGVIEVIIGGAMLVLAALNRTLVLWPAPAYPYPYILPYIPFEHPIAVESPWLIIVGVPLIFLGIVSIVGGVSAVRRKRFGLSLAGAVCALPCAVGILAVIFIALGKREFGAES